MVAAGWLAAGFAGEPNRLLLTTPDGTEVFRTDRIEELRFTPTDDADRELWLTVEHFAAAPDEFKLDADSRVRFSLGQMHLLNNETEVKRFPLSGISSLILQDKGGDVVGVSTIENAGAWRLLGNPVADEIRIGGEADAPFAIHSMQGALVLKGYWRGENIDVRDLAQGVYVLSIGNQSFKIVKL